MSDAGSAIDEIFNLSKKMDEALEKISTLEKSVKSLNNKFIILTKKMESIKESSAQKEEVSKAIPKAEATMPVSLPSESLESEEPVTNNKLVLGAVKTYGYIVDEKRTPIPNIIVSIYDSSGDKIRGMKTNADGYWEARLPSAKYQIVYSHKDFADVKKEILIPKGSTNFRVS